MNKKNWLFVVLAGVISLTAFNSCKKSDDEDSSTDTGPTEWVQGSGFDGDKRDGAASFQIGTTGYLVGGLLTTNERTADAWSFDGSQFKKIADFPGGPRSQAVGFVAGGKGYVGLGNNGANATFDDFYMFDPATGKWSTTAIAKFPGEARYGAVAFTLNDKGYVGLGASKTQKAFKDFYEYNPQSNTWKEVPNPLKNKRVGGFAFVVGSKAYVGGGSDNNQFPEDFFSFDGSNWSEETPLKDDNSTYDLTRQNASTFVIGNFGYVVGGSKGTVLSTVWKYDVAAKKWESKHQALPRNAREGAVAFSIGGKGYLTTGKNSANKFDDTWIFTQVR